MHFGISVIDIDHVELKPIKMPSKSQCRAIAADIVTGSGAANRS